MGTDKRSAAEFSFFLAMPTMAGAFAYDFYKNRNTLSMDDGVLIGVGFICAFITAVIVVRLSAGFRIEERVLVLCMVADYCRRTWADRALYARLKTPPQHVERQNCDEQLECEPERLFGDARQEP